MELTIWNTGVLLITFGVFAFSRHYIAERDRMTSKLLNLLERGDFEEFDDLSKTRSALLYVPTFNLQFLRLSRSSLQRDTATFRLIMEQFDKMKMNKKQASSVYLKAFYYYLSVEEHAEAKKCYERIDSVKNDEYLNIIYDIFIERGNKYLDHLLRIVSSCNASEKAMYESLIAKIYKNIGDTVNEEKYSKLAENDFLQIHESSEKPIERDVL